MAMIMLMGTCQTAIKKPVSSCGAVLTGIGVGLFVPDATDARQGEGVVCFVAVVVERALSSSPHGRRFG